MIPKGYEVGCMDILINGSINEVDLIKISEESASNFSGINKGVKEIIN